MKSKIKKEIKFNELTAINKKIFTAAIKKEIKNNIDIGAYRPISLEESAVIRRESPEKVMESRFVLTAKPLEPHEVLKYHWPSMTGSSWSGKQTNLARPKPDMS